MGAEWPIDGGGGEVTSVFGRKGAVVKQSGDYAVADITGLGTALGGKASENQLSLLAGMELRGVVERDRAAAKHRVEYEDAPQLLEQWASLGNWTTLGTPVPAVSSGKLVGSGNVGASISGLYRSLSLGTAGRGRALFPINLPSSAGAGGAYIACALVSDTGVPTQVSTVMANGPTWLLSLGSGWMGINNRGTFTNASGFSIVSIPGGGEFYTAGNYPAYGSISLTTAQTAYLDVEVDELWINFNFIGPGHNYEVRCQMPRSTVGTGGTAGQINEIFIGVMDSRGASGATIGPAVVKASLANYSPRSASVAAGAETTTDRVIWTRTGGSNALGDAARIWLPANYDSRVPTPTVLYSHLYGGYEGETYDNTTFSPAFAALVNAGWIVAASDNEGQGFGNSAVQANLLALYEYLRDHLNIGPIIASGSSMGGAAAANLVAARSVPGIVGLMLFSPLLNLSWFWSQLATGGQYATYQSAFEAAYDLSSLSDPTYAAKVNPFDPMLQSPSAFRGVRTRIAYSSDDGLTVPANNGAQFLSQISGYVPEATSYVTTGGHVSAAQYSDTSDIVGFATRCIAS